MCNVGHKDQVIRFFAGIVFLVLAPILGSLFGSLIGFIVGAVGVIAILTSVFNYCPLYSILKIKTTKE